MQTKSPVRSLVALLTAALLLASAAQAQQGGVLGYWKEPGGAVIHIEPCGSTICATLAVLSRSAPARIDLKNPNRTLQQRSLCGLQIGQGFHLTSPVKAEAGTLYDPKSGKTYRAAITNNGDQLNLRGYIGLSIFGRTEKWTRTAAVDTCRS